MSGYCKPGTKQGLIGYVCKYNPERLRLFNLNKGENYLKVLISNIGDWVFFR